MSSTATTRAVAARSRKSAPSNAAAVSAAKPGPPVSCALRPGSRPSATAVRISSTRSPASPLDSWAASTGARTRAASPSSAGIGPCGCAPTTAAIRSPAAAAAASPCGPSSPPSERVTTSTAGTDPASGNSCWIWETSAASDSSGNVCGAPEDDSEVARANAAPVISSTTTSTTQADTLPVSTRVQPSAATVSCDAGLSAVIVSLVFTRCIRRGTPRGWR